MSRPLTVAAAQSGPIQKAESRQAVVKRLCDLLDQANAQGVNFVVFTELALTTFFPRWYMTDEAEVDSWFEREMPNAATRPLFEKAAQYKIGFYLGYAELTPDGHHYNTAILVDRDGKIVGKYRKVHLPGPFRVRSRARVPASGEALLRARQSRLSGVAHDGWHFRDVCVQ
jgi:predicted amidohydrolase